DLSVEPAAFREQMAYLAANGYTTIDLYDLSLAITGKQTLPPRPVILTFDDGYRDAYENAFPILKEFGLEGTFFIATDFIDRGHPAYLTWPMVEEMAAAGMRMEPHSKTHVDLYGKEHDLVVYQVLGSLQTVEAHVGYRPRYFAYPGGTYDDQTIEVLQALDFWGAVVTAGGKWHGFNDRYEWTRLRIRHTTTLPVFMALVEGQE
ncbi:MAG: polysaccharide deacetylase family protein, partial [Chloroflexota bacterium]